MMIDSSFWMIFIAMIYTLGIASGLLIVALFDLSVTVRRNNPKPIVNKQARAKKESSNGNDDNGFLNPNEARR